MKVNNIKVFKNIYLAVNDIAMGRIPIELPPNKYLVVELAAPLQAW